MGKPSIALIEGAAVGAGLAVALACDMRFASPDAYFMAGFARVGLSGDFGAVWLLTRAVGSVRAAELMLLSERVDAARAEQLGLVNALVPAEELEAFVMDKARMLADGPRMAYAGI